MSVGTLLDRDELPAERDLAREAGGEAVGDQVVAAADVETLVRLAEERELGLLDEADQVEEVERALNIRLGAVLDVVRDVEQLGELRVAAAGDRLVEVLRDRHVVELEPALREAVVERRVAGGLRVVAPDLRRALDSRSPARGCSAGRRTTSSSPRPAPRLR